MLPRQIENKIYEVGGYNVMFDFDLAELYEVETRVLNQAVKRNIDIFPQDFMFQLTADQWKTISSQFVMTLQKTQNLKSQIVTSSWGGTRKRSYAFTEHGVAMLANVLKSKKARQTSVSIVRAFIALKQFALNYKELADKLKTLEGKYDDVYEAINYLLEKDKEVIEHKERIRIGYKAQK